jgi:glutamate formiminotransferase
MSTLVECVPNFSEGRDKSKVDAIVDAMKTPGVYLLDREMTPTTTAASSRWSASARQFKRRRFAGWAKPPN